MGSGIKGPTMRSTNAAHWSALHATERDQPTDGTKIEMSASWRVGGAPNGGRPGAHCRVAHQARPLHGGGKGST